MDRERIGKYRILGEVGRGTMGIVYEALDPVLQRRVALKTISVEAGLDEEALQRFRSEARAAALLNHPNIVTIHDYGEDGRTLYMAMEFLEGPDLRDAIDESLLPELDQKLDVMEKVLEALEYAHARHVVHRDIKPANIHLGSGRHVKIMDFGLARTGTSEMTQEGIVLGTPNYMSPEQALGDPVDGRSDIFSTGAVLYELLTEHRPFEAESTPSVLFQVVHRQPPPVRRWAPNVPVPLVDVVNRALAKDVRKRFAGASEMKAALSAARRAVAVGPSIAPSDSGRSMAAASAPSPASSRGRSGSSSKRRMVMRRRRPKGRLLAAGAGVAVIVGLAVSVPWLRQHLGHPAPARNDAQVGELTRELVATQVQLAQRELDDKNWAGAERQAQAALHLAPGHAGAVGILEAARARLAELNVAVAAARSGLEAGDTAAASEALSRLLELDPRHPAATELSARLNAVFLTQAEAAAASMSAARDHAVEEGAVGSREFAAADAKADEADELVMRGEYADATRTFLEARDAFDRSRHDAETRQRTTRRQTRATPTPRMTASQDARGGTSPPIDTPTRRGAASASPPVVSPASALPAHRFRTGETTVTTKPAGELAGFEAADVRTQRPPRFEGRVTFEVLPAQVRAGEPFVVRVHLANEGRDAVRIQGMELVVVKDGRRSAPPVTVLQQEVASRDQALLAEYSGVWSSARSWTMEAVIMVDKDERVHGRLSLE